MIKINKKNKCCGCSSCYNICPTKSIEMVEDEEGFYYPKVDENKCVNCGKCESVCPMINDLNKNNNESSRAFAVKNTNDNIRLQSSSGGFFSSLAEYVINKNGVVYGVSFSDDNLSVNHIRITNIDELSKIRGSKYIQANSVDAFSMVKKDLQGRIVLFSGTSCQIKGLKLFLGKEYDNLLCSEVICHGVPSEKLWRNYIKYLAKKENSVINEVNFRDKTNGWNNDFYLTIKIDDIEHKKIFNEEVFGYFFVKNYSLRPSCYNCNSKSGKSMADFTMADFWGIDFVDSTFNDNKGTSLVLTHNSKAEKIINELKNSYNLFLNETDYEMSIRYNKSYFNSVRMPVERETFYTDLNSLEFKTLVKKYYKLGLKFKLKKFIKNTRVGKFILKHKN